MKYYTPHVNIIIHSIWEILIYNELNDSWKEWEEGTAPTAAYK